VRIEELTDGGVEEGGLVHVEDVAAFESEEGCVGAAESHPLEVFGGGDAALCAANEKGRTDGGEEIVPMIAAEGVLGGDHLVRLEGEGPTVGSLAEGIREVGGEALANFGYEVFASGRDAGPVEDEADVVGDDGADVFNDERGDLFGMAGGELEGVDAAEGTAEQHGLRKVEMGKECFEVADVVGALVGGRVAGAAVAALIERDDAPMRCEVCGEGREGGGFHQVAVESNEDARVGSGMGAGIEIGECETVVFEGMALKIHGRGLMSH
jgi:hypothetical protein